MDPQRPIYPQRVRKKRVGLISRISRIWPGLMSMAACGLRAFRGFLVRRTFRTSGGFRRIQRFRIRNVRIQTQDSGLRTEDSMKSMDSHEIHGNPWVQDTELRTQYSA